VVAGSRGDEGATTEGRFVELWIRGIGARFQTPVSNQMTLRGTIVVSGYGTMGMD
jgi:hypothetical protein